MDVTDSRSGGRVSGSRVSGSRASSSQWSPARALTELVAWVGDKLRRLQRDVGVEAEHVRSSLQALERACDPATNPRLRGAMVQLGIAAADDPKVAAPATAQAINGEVHAWTFRRVPRGANKLLRAHWAVPQCSAVRRREEKAWRILIRSVCGRPQARVEARVRLEVTVKRPRLQDPDNAHASLKPVLDALVSEGWLKDDSCEWLDLAMREVVEKDRARMRTEVVWSRVGG